MLRRRAARWLFGTAGAVILLLAWAGAVSGDGGEPRDLGALPAFSLATLDGRTMERSSLDGGVTVVNFWASWCPPCRSEAPILARVAKESAADGVQFLGVLHQDRREPALEFAAEQGLDFPTVIDDGTLAGPLGVRSIPMTFVVGADGAVLARHFGPISEGRLRVLIADARAVSGDDAADGS